MLLRITAVLFLVCTAIYALLYLYLRDGIREAHAERWAVTGRDGDREVFVQRESAPAEARLRKRLALWVYGIPFAAVFVWALVSDT